MVFRKRGFGELSKRRRVMKLTLNHLFWFVLLVIALIAAIGNSSIMNSSFAIFAFIVVYLLMISEKNGELDLGKLIVNSSLVCLSFLAFEKGMFDYYILWPAIAIVVLAILPATYHHIYKTR